ncbi:MAG: GNAT family N-acetyltransferase [Lachnospiraceae bacterium]|nr:GNAT family N-acetyltransferase [Lachnospiraceae bacterium]
MITIERVETGRGRKEFAEFPNRLYKGEPLYIPAFYSDSLAAMNPSKHFAYEFCEARFYLAKKDGIVVGRIGAIINHKADEKWNTRQMRFWNVDFVNDMEISAALFKVVEEWAKERECTEIVGPLGFTDLDPEGMLVDGFDEEGIFCTYYNYPYYVDHLKALGYEKDADWVEYKLNLQEGEETAGTIERMAEFSGRVYKLHLKEMTSVKDIGNAAPDIVRLINLCYRDLYGTTDMDIAQGTEYFKSFQIILDYRTSAIVYNESGELVGFALSIPNISDAIKKSGGRLFPLGWFRILRKVKKNDEQIALLIGVHPDYQSKGVISLIINHMMKAFRRLGIRSCRCCPMLEENSKVLSLMNVVPSKPCRRRRSFIKHL